MSRSELKRFYQSLVAISNDMEANIGPVRQAFAKVDELEDILNRAGLESDHDPEFLYERILAAFQAAPRDPMSLDQFFVEFEELAEEWQDVDVSAILDCLEELNDVTSIEKLFLILEEAKEMMEETLNKF